jgi:hypothetical protein
MARVSGAVWPETEAHVVLPRLLTFVGGLALLVGASTSAALGQGAPYRGGVFGLPGGGGASQGGQYALTGVIAGFEPPTDNSGAYRLGIVPPLIPAGPPVAPAQRTFIPTGFFSAR